MQANLFLVAHLTICVVVMLARTAGRAVRRQFLADKPSKSDER